MVVSNSDIMRLCIEIVNIWVLIVNNFYGLFDIGMVGVII